MLSWLLRWFRASPVKETVIIPTDYPVEKQSRDVARYVAPTEQSTVVDLSDSMKRLQVCSLEDGEEDGDESMIPFGSWGEDVNWGRKPNDPIIEWEVDWE